MMDTRKVAGLMSGVGAGFLAARTLVAGRRRFDFNGAVAIVTGGSRGLGLALAHELVRRGARVAICARDEVELESARRELEKVGGDVFAGPCDITDRSQVERFVARVREEFGEVDVLVNNAGVIEVGPLETMTVGDFEEAMRTHFYGPLYFTMACAPDMRRRRTGRVVNISSFGGFVAVPHLAPYSASKFALTGFSDSLRPELARDDVFVTTVLPGLMRTGSPRHAFFKGHPLAEYRWFVSGAALPGVAMSPQRAARKIISASESGRAQLVLTPQAKLAIRVKALFPGLVQQVLQGVAVLLPDGYEGTRTRVEGADLEPPRGGSIIDKLQRYWALRLNEYAR